MMKFLTTALGGLTVATVTGLALLPGHAMLGGGQPQAQAPVSVIADPGPKAAMPVPAPAAVPVAPASAPAAPAQPAVAAPAAAPAVTHSAPTVSRPAAQPVARPVAPAAAPVARPAPAANPMGGLAGAGAITQLLLNMPQVLQGGQGGPQVGAPGGPGWVPPGQRGRDHRKHPGGDDNSGDFER